MKITKRQYRLTVIIIALGFIGWPFCRMMYALYNDRPQPSRLQIAEYTTLFAKEAKTKLEIYGTTTTRTRHPVSTYIFDKRYYVQVFKVKLTADIDVKKLIHETNEDSDGGMMYSDMPAYNYDLRVGTGKADPVNSIIFRFDDQLKTIIKNDHIAFYYLIFNKCSISYNNSSEYEIWAVSHHKVKKPMNIAFIKKKQNLYIVIMTVVKGKEDMKSEALYKLLSK